MELLFSNRVSKEISDRVISRSEKLPIDPDWFMFLSDFESGLSPYRENSFGCMSWIQFCPDFSGGAYKTIKGKRYYFADMKTWTPGQLLDLSFEYLEEQQSTHGRFSDYSDLYFAILWPAAIGKPDTYVLETKSNPIFDINKDRIITKGEVKQFLEKRVKEKAPSSYWSIFFKKKTFFSCIREKSSSQVLSLQD